MLFRCRLAAGFRCRIPQFRPARKVAIGAVVVPQIHLGKQKCFGWLQMVAALHAKKLARVAGCACCARLCVDVFFFIEVHKLRFKRETKSTLSLVPGNIP